MCVCSTRKNEKWFLPDFSFSRKLQSGLHCNLLCDSIGLTVYLFTTSFQMYNSFLGKYRILLGKNCYWYALILVQGLMNLFCSDILCLGTDWVPVWTKYVSVNGNFNQSHIYCLKNEALCWAASSYCNSTDFPQYVKICTSKRSDGLNSNHFMDLR